MEDKTLWKSNKEGDRTHLNSSALSILFRYVSNVTDKEKEDLKVRLTKEGHLLKPSGRASYSQAILELCDYITKTLKSDLIEKGSSSFKFSDPSLLDGLEYDAKGKEILIKNIFGDPKNVKAIVEDSKS